MNTQPGIALPEFLSAPRPNGSRALDRAVGKVETRLEWLGVDVQSHHFTLRPYSMELLGLWLLLGGILLPLAALLRWGWLGLVLALLTVAVPLLEVRFLRPTVTALVRRPARNLVARFSPTHPRREVILCAHLDSKTELLDHHQRRMLVRLSLPAIALVLISGILIALERLLPAGAARQVVYWLAFLSALPGAAYGLGRGPAAGDHLHRQGHGRATGPCRAESRLAVVIPGHLHRIGSAGRGGIPYPPGAVLARL